MFRALVYGACMGGLIGGLSALVAVAVFVGPTEFGFGLALSPVVGAACALCGLACMVGPGLVLAIARTYFRRRLRLARAVAAGAGGLLLGALEALTYDNPAGYNREEWVLIAEVFAVGAALAAMGAGYVVTGRKCLVARRFLRLK
jgi:hypothetical protein